jgi:hypothetical protein
MATKIVDTVRKPLIGNPGDAFTLKREQHKEIENIKLVSHFADWLSKVTEEPVRAESFPEDLQNGICLCKLLIMIGPDTGVTKYHELPAKNVLLDKFKAKENIVQFQEGCKRLALPVVFGMSELEAGNLGKIASCLVFLAHTASTRGVGVRQMDAELRARVESVSLANESVLESSPSAAAMVIEQTQQPELTWWQQLLVKFGFGDYMDFDLEKLKAYALKVKEDLIKQGSEKATSFKDNLPESIKQRISA